MVPTTKPIADFHRRVTAHAGRTINNQFFRLCVHEHKRKNWLFSNTPSGARASAVYHSLIVTAIENGTNPFEYLRWIFTNAPNLGKPGYAAAIVDLLPGNIGNTPESVYTEAQENRA
jgi:hypothetical protein